MLAAVRALQFTRHYMAARMLLETLSASSAVLAVASKMITGCPAGERRTDPGILQYRGYARHVVCGAWLAPTES